MLTASQVETVAFTTEHGEILHYDCAGKAYSTIAVEKADAGFTDTGLRPLSRFELDEWVGEDTYESARGRVDDFEYDHPALAALFGVERSSGEWVKSDGAWFGRWVYPQESRNYQRLVERIADKHETGPSCDHCGGYVHEAPLA